MPEQYPFLDTERYMWITLQITDRSIAGWYGNNSNKKERSSKSAYK
ncbi:hypothetical protein FHR92_000757 [Fontibacillus solani]|uniref:Uncharacterized protein n=1 Tax=Fontibacillus solani TaxID=1572857 RepID=A0A7W3XQA2_9BACL|nr:hypothetical protein [Fontibacillus solani]MBA9084303.1 hypothetical protein [Fontibacillus solani]